MTPSEKRRIADAVNEIWVILRGLDSPQSAAKALAGAHVMLMELGAVQQNEAGIRAALKDVDDAVLETWSKRSGVQLAS